MLAVNELRLSFSLSENVSSFYHLDSHASFALTKKRRYSGNGEVKAVKYLTRETLIHINDLLGYSDLVREENLLGSALTAPQNAAYYEAKIESHRVLKGEVASMFGLPFLFFRNNAQHCLDEDAYALDRESVCYTSLILEYLARQARSRGYVFARANRAYCHR